MAVSPASATVVITYHNAQTNDIPFDGAVGGISVYGDMSESLNYQQRDDGVTIKARPAPIGSPVAFGLLVEATDPDAEAFPAERFKMDWIKYYDSAGRVWATSTPVNSASGCGRANWLDPNGVNQWAVFFDFPTNGTINEENYSTACWHTSIIDSGYQSYTNQDFGTMGASPRIGIGMTCFYDKSDPFYDPNHTPCLGITDAISRTMPHIP